MSVGSSLILAAIAAAITYKLGVGARTAIAAYVLLGSPCWRFLADGSVLRVSLTDNLYARQAQVLGATFYMSIFCLRVKLLTCLSVVQLIPITYKCGCSILLAQPYTTIQHLEMSIAKILRSNL